VYISEAAHINMLDDSKVYDALHPNIANIENADFIIESTPNGRRGFFWDLWDERPDAQANAYMRRASNVAFRRAARKAAGQLRNVFRAA